MVELAELQAARHQVVAARRAAAAAQAQLAAACVEYADIRVDGGSARHRCRRAQPRAGAARVSSWPTRCRCCCGNSRYPVRCLIARTRRLTVGLPAVWQAYQAGALDAEQVRIIDRVARRVAAPHTLTAIDELVVDAAQTRCPKQLGIWLLRLVVQLEPLAFEQRHRKALAERRVTVVQGADGIGYVTGEVSAADAAAIDATLAAPGPQPREPRIRGPTSNAAPTCSPTCSSADSSSMTTVTTRSRTKDGERDIRSSVVDTGAADAVRRPARLSDTERRPDSHGGRVGLGSGSQPTVLTGRPARLVGDRGHRP